MHFYAAYPGWLNPLTRGVASAEHNNSTGWFKASSSYHQQPGTEECWCHAQSTSLTLKQCSIALQLIRCSSTQFCPGRTINSFRELAQQIVPRRAAIRHSIPFHPRGEKSILADKYFLSNYVGIQSTLFSICNILKQWKVSEHLFIKKRLKLLLSGKGQEWESMKDQIGHSLNRKIASKPAWPHCNLRRNKVIYFFQISEMNPKHRSHTLESKDP